MSRALLFMAALSGCGAAGSDHVAAGNGPHPAAPAGEPSAGCALTVSFGSYAMGIDAGTLAAVEALLAEDGAVASVERRGWGREGEVALCARIATDADAERLHRRIAVMLPANPRGPIHATTRTGLSVHAPRR